MILTYIFLITRVDIAGGHGVDTFMAKPSVILWSETSTRATLTTACTQSAHRQLTIRGKIKQFNSNFGSKHLYYIHTILFTVEKK